MTDLELLQLAAKAAGIRHINYNNDYNGSYGLMQVNQNGDHTMMWNPLGNDGDAFRLAISLEISVAHDRDFPTGERVVRIGCIFNDTLYADVEGPENNPYEATRRGITRAAAEIGKTR